MRIKLNRLCAIFLTPVFVLCLAACEKDMKSEDKVEVETPTVEVEGPIVSTVAGKVSSGAENGPGLMARFFSPTSISIDLNGNAFVADYHNHAIRKITPGGIVTTLAGGRSGDTNMTLNAFNGPSGIAVDSHGFVFVADNDNHKVKRTAPDGTITLIAGSTQGELDGPLGINRLNYPSAVAIDESTGSLYVSQFTSYVKCVKDRYVKTLAGGIKYNYADAAFKYPLGIVVNSQKELIVSDYGKNQIFQINANNEVTVIAGSGIAGSADGQGSKATFNLPQGMAIDKEDNIYVADRGNHKIRKITRSGVVSTVAGNGQPGTADGVGKMASFNEPTGIAIDQEGNLLITDRGNHLIRKITFPQ